MNALRSAVVALPVLLLSAAEGAATEPDPRSFDPYEGMDRDGRIPRASRPPGLENPERWRYVPEGRIKPGNIFRRFMVSSFAVPFVFNDSDVGTGLGLAITDIDFRQQRRREFAGAFFSYTTEGQQNYSFVWRRWSNHLELADGGVLLEERSFLRASGGYSKTLTRRFYGFGPGSNESAETSFTDSRLDLDVGLRRALPERGGDFLFDFGVRGELHELSSGKVSNTPSTLDQFPGLIRGSHANLGWLKLGIAWDSRDSQSNAYTGWELAGELEVALLQRGGDVGERYTLRASRVFRLPGLFHSGGDSNEENPPTDALAFLLHSQMSSGRLPFFALPSLGGGRRHRGFIEGRFRDKASWLGGVEYRFWVLPRGFRIPFTRAIRIERVGGALFYELGAVARSPRQIFHARPRHTYGASLRITLERAAPFRVDFAFSEDGLKLTARFGLSF